LRRRRLRLRRRGGGGARGRPRCPAAALRRGRAGEVQQQRREDERREAGENFSGLHLFRNSWPQGAGPTSETMFVEACARLCRASGGLSLARHFNAGKAATPSGLSVARATPEPLTSSAVADATPIWPSRSYPAFQRRAKVTRRCGGDRRTLQITRRGSGGRLPSADGNCNPRRPRCNFRPRPSHAQFILEHQARAVHRRRRRRTQS